MKKEMASPRYGGARYPVAVLLDNRRFVEFHVDAAVGDYVPAAPEAEREPGFLSFANIEAAVFRVLPRDDQFAEKLHAYTLPRSGANSRVRDLVDMALLINEGKLSQAKTKAALASVFSRRKTHSLPRFLASAPVSWESSFRELSEECGLELDLPAAFELLQKYYRSLR